MSDKEEKSLSEEGSLSEDAERLFKNQGRVLLILLVLFGLALAIFLVSRGGGSESVATVKGVSDGKGTVSKEDFDRAFTQVWKRAGLKSAPKEGDPQYKETLESAMGGLIDQAWIWGESQERGFSVSSKQIQDEINRLIETQFQGKQKLFDKFKAENGFNEADVVSQVELQLLSREIEKQVGQRDIQAFIGEYSDKWKARTTCAKGYIVPQCSNYSDGRPTITKGSGEPPSRVVTKTLKEGSGPEAKKNSLVSVDYVGALFETGKVFDSSWDSGQPLEVTLGSGSVIPGFNQGLVGIKKGERREITIPANLAYGKRGSPPAIPPNSALIFVVDARSVSE